MRIRPVPLVAPLAGILLLWSTADRALAQGPGRANVTMTITARVPSIVKYVVDETVRTADGSPTVRVVSNDPGIRAAFARGVTPELAPVALASATPEESGHAK